MKRVFLIVLDSVGIGEMPDAAEYNDEGSNTLFAVSSSKNFDMPNLKKMGLFNIDSVKIEKKEKNPIASYARMGERSKGKDTTIGHWEIAGIISDTPLPVYPEGFPKEILEKFSEETGRGILCNKPYSGTDVIKDYGKAHVDTGKLIVYTSADSVFQIAAHEDVVPLKELYRYSEIARKLLTGEHGVGRVIARPFLGTEGDYYRTPNRHDYSILPPDITMLDQIKEAGKEVIAVGKIYDIFGGQGITESVYIKSNKEGIEKTLSYMDIDFEGICFTNLVDFDMLYGHRNDIDGYAGALKEFDDSIPQILEKLREDDILLITADHGCDPSTASTDHSREYTPLIMYGLPIEPKNLGTRETFADISATILKYFNIEIRTKGNPLI
ncbi:phosphopentomutase [uncultured Robinsoniella sp.]|uniref:phosphopentomutase n=1 Tax=uncultured Robinsoniella sp. TaxID=904190 RepID=UPI00374E6FFD